MTRRHDFGGVLGRRPLDTSFWALTTSWSQLLLVCEVALKDNKVKPPKTNTMYHMHTLGASKRMHVVHSVGFVIAVGFGWFYLTNSLTMVKATLVSA